MNKSFLYFICAVSAMGGLLFGYDWVVIGGAKPFYEVFFDITHDPLMQGVAMSTALVGCLVGAMVAGDCMSVAVSGLKWVWVRPMGW